ncbi:uncharacterized protein LOC119664905, partial [Teleopsis dalmanni]|uniref:uncharacterized protein LOC119664905 n=1 Tax=Teleopsis dalmanni TaxID=139649 RepID=UPI0018CEA89C
MKTKQIDLIIGSDIIPKIIKKGFKKINGIIAQETIFGWIISGKVLKKPAKRSKVTITTKNIEKFWELEEADNTINEKTAEDEICMQFYDDTTKIDGDKKFIVKLPLKKDATLGESRNQAMARFLNQEKKMSNEKRTEYIKFMQEYEQKGHMEKVKDNTIGKYYLPHQAVIRESSRTTKLRVVFDTSAKSTNGKSLNDIMMTGPRLQQDIFDILMKWRLWKFVASADVEKMFRQIKIAREDQDYQRILWRENAREKIMEYRLTTVTYGTAAAPFLAVRTLHQIADESEENKDIKNSIKKEFYMDDLMTGANSISECRHKINKINKTLSLRGFQLRKWMSNHESILEELPDDNEIKILNIHEDESVKTLGLKWNPIKDNFHFTIKMENINKWTKRMILSNTAHIFDPLDKIKIPRWIGTTNSKTWEFHGFCDASEAAYAAVIYVKIGSSVKLLTAKSKVSPIKNKKTIPKLELCGSHLLAKLMRRVSQILNNNATIYCWSDSMITLCWIKNIKNKEKFVRTRVEDIKKWIPKTKWQHVKSQENPADIASRGICPSKLKYNPLWWNGPSWLTKEEKDWPKPEKIEEVKILTTVTSQNNEIIEQLMETNSSLT